MTFIVDVTAPCLNLDQFELRQALQGCDNRGRFQIKPGCDVARRRKATAVISELKIGWDVAFVECFPAVVSLEILKTTKGLEEMLVIRKGSRLSIQPVTRAEFDIVSRLGRATRQATETMDRLRA